MFHVKHRAGARAEGAHDASPLDAMAHHQARNGQAPCARGIDRNSRERTARRIPHPAPSTYEKKTLHDQTRSMHQKRRTGDPSDAPGSHGTRQAAPVATGVESRVRSVLSWNACAYSSTVKPHRNARSARAGRGRGWGRGGETVGDEVGERRAKEKGQVGKEGRGRLHLPGAAFPAPQSIRRPCQSPGTAGTCV